MTIIQLEYIIAVSNFKHFAKAANYCKVTQPTLSMQIQKLEEELEIKIFDRSKQPVIATELGSIVLEHAKKIIAEKNNLTQILLSAKEEAAGELKIGILPTLAPYLLPLFLNKLMVKYPKIIFKIHELTTDDMVRKLKENTIDVGILATPLNEKSISEFPIFYEELIVYLSKKNDAYKNKYFLVNNIDPSKLWLLEEGHCFRSQILNLCDLKKNFKHYPQFEYAAGSFETLKKIVDTTDGLTILPEMATHYFTSTQLSKIRHFKHPAPVREVSMVLHRNYAKQNLIQILRTEILEVIPEKFKKNKKTYIPSIKFKES
jgi:LysR family hydrogen peroxide-inducible transcriptional activator